MSEDEKGATISSIICRVNRNSFGYFINSVRVVLRDSREVMVFEQSNLGDEIEATVPDGYIIVGLYGKTTTVGPKRICSLGFIIMDVT